MQQATSSKFYAELNAVFSIQDTILLLVCSDESRDQGLTTYHYVD